ncbi:MAG: MoxR family ATPase [Clostridiales bacterium]|nr:MoxR family ATPase [Clostridiales bacterium]
MQNQLVIEQTNVLNQIRDIINEVKKVIIGKDEIIIKALIAILAKGHILIEDIPGVGKTTLALAFSKALSLEYKRLQFTPDVLPSDVTGFSIFNKNTGNFEYKPGAAMCNLFLADEINRTSSKTQSALLEIMEEGRITVDGVTRNAPDPYIVIATQNPIGSIGTQLLPESQLDRFTIRLSVGYPDSASEVEMLKSKQNNNPLSNVKSVITIEQLQKARDITEEIYVSDKVYEYIVALAKATREHPAVKLGLSPRGTIALTNVTKATALLKGRNYALPDDVLYSFYDTIEHRIILDSKTKINKITTRDVLNDIIKTTPVPKVSRVSSNG